MRRTPTAPQERIAGLDIGTSKVAILVIELDDEGSPHYVSGTLLETEAGGVRDGVIVDMAEVIKNIEQARTEVEQDCGQRITRACVAVSGRHLTSLNLRGAATITPIGREISNDDVARALASARTGLRSAENRELLHVIPRAYMIDGQVGVRDPRGMAGRDLEVEVHYTTATGTTVQNLVKCVKQARIEPDMLVAAPLAAGEAVRDRYADAECMMVADIGAETTNLAMYIAGTIWLTEVLPEGGASLTRELASQMKIPFYAAEELKVRHGHCDPEQIQEFALVDIPESVGVDAVLPQREIARILEQRTQKFAERLTERLRAIRRLGVEPEALALTGGGAELAGLDDALMHALDLPVYRESPVGIHGLPPLMASPSFATAAGLALWQARFASQEHGRRGRDRLNHIVANLGRRFFGATS
ncbi:MAG TPA: cell division protein FtsA [Ktedonobacterales bacterium]|nr:cell division protein FtsA [Ktedonobacterales bacterium]